MLISLESGDAGGKATQTRLLVDHLRAVGIAAESMSFPNYESETGKLILKMLKGERSFTCGMHGESRDYEDDALALQVLMLANRFEVFTKLRGWADGWTGDDGHGNLVCWTPQSFLLAQRPAVLVLDRFWLSGLVYGQADGLDRDWLLSVHAALPPAHHLVLDVPPEEALCRRPEARDRFEADREKQARVRQIYLEEWSRSLKPGETLHGRVHLVEGVGTVEEVAERVWRVVEDLLRV